MQKERDSVQATLSHAVGALGRLLEQTLNPQINGIDAEAAPDDWASANPSADRQSLLCGLSVRLQHQLKVPLTARLNLVLLHDPHWIGRLRTHQVH